VTNAEVVRESWRLWSEGDLDRAIELMYPDVVVVAPEGWPEGAVSEGREAWAAQARRLRETWEKACVEVDEIREVDESRVLGRLRYVTRGKDAEFAFETPLTAILELADGKIRRAEYFWTVEEAEASLG
jgi:ketosteroid isomerase-like protein